MTDQSASAIELGSTAEEEKAPVMPPTEGETGERFSSPFSTRAGKTLKWSNVDFTVKKKGKNVAILKDAWGEVRPHQLCCIMGPSGAGKTTLLNVLAGRVIFQTGNVTVNERRINPIKEKKSFAYVMQEDAMFPCLTAREALFFSAKLRIPDDVSNEKKHELVDRMIEELGLEKCADTMIGSNLIKGLSGGEKRRAAVGVELVTNPDMVFLDEPTSGLDSTSARRCIQLLTKVCNAGTLVICTIHQPSSEIFSMFSQNILMKNGRIVYQGPGCADGELQSYFKGRGFEIPTFFNPSDFVMDLIQEKTEEELETSGVLMPAPKATEKTANEVQVMPDFQATSGFFTQIYWLGWREFITLRRNVAGTAAPFIIDGVLHLIFGLIFQGVGRGDPNDPDELNAHFGAIQFVYISAMFGSSSSALLTFPVERPLFLREYSNGTYGALTYFISKIFVQSPMDLLKSIYTVCIIYWLMGLDGNLILHALALFLLGQIASSIALVLGSVTGDVQQANQFSPLVFVPQLLFSGFFIRLELIPQWLRWAQYLCGLKYSVNVGSIIEFWEPCDVEACDELLADNDMYPDKVWVYVAIMIALYAGFRITALRVLMAKAKSVY